MDVVWSVQFLIALVCFMAPTIVAARLVYRRIVISDLRRNRTVRKANPVRVQPAAPPTEAKLPEPEVIAAAAAPVPFRSPSMHLPIENLRLRLIEFRGSLQRSRAALGHLQECDWQVSGDLNRASQIMHQAFAEKAPPADAGALGPRPVKNIISAA
jgi:hypothetical protein